MRLLEWSGFEWCLEASLRTFPVLQQHVKQFRSNSGFFLTRALVLAGGNHLGRWHRVTSLAHLCWCGTATTSTLIALWFYCDVCVPRTVTGGLCKGLLVAILCSVVPFKRWVVSSRHRNITTCTKALYYQMPLWFCVFAHWVDTSVQRDIDVLQLTTLSLKHRAEIRNLSPPELKNPAF